MPRVYIGRLSYQVREKDIQRFFSGYGKLMEIDLKNGYGFVEFDDNRDADDAVYELNGKDLCGDRVVVEHARGPRRDRDSYDGEHGRSSGCSSRGHIGRDKYGPPVRTEYRLIVHNLSTRCSWQDLKDLMRQAGEVTYADAHKDRTNEGVVEFYSRSDMKRALDKLDGKDVNGRRIRLVEERPRRKRSYSGSRSRSRSRRRSRSLSRRSSRSPSRSRSRSRSNKRSRRSPPQSRSRRSKSRSGRRRSRSVRSKSRSGRRRSRSVRSKSPSGRSKSRSRRSKSRSRRSKSRSGRSQSRSSRNKSRGSGSPSQRSVPPAGSPSKVKSERVSRSRSPSPAENGCAEPAPRSPSPQGDARPAALRDGRSASRSSSRSASQD